MVRFRTQLLDYAVKMTNTYGDFGPRNGMTGVFSVRDTVTAYRDHVRMLRHAAQLAVFGQHFSNAISV